MNLDELEEYYFCQKRDGMDYSEIRAELENRNLSDEDIRILIRSIDNKILQEDSNAFIKMKGNELKVIGSVLLIGGLVLSVGSWKGWINLGGYTIIAFGPIISGIALIAGAKSNKSRKSSRNKPFRNSR